MKTKSTRHLGVKYFLALLLTLFFSTQSINAQRAYYWRGAAAGGSWLTNSNWNLAVDGSSTSRNTPNVGDTLIFDGTASNFLGSSASNPVLVTAVPYQTIKNLIFRNSAFVKFTTSPGTASSGTTAAGAFVGTQPNATGQTITGTGTSFTTFFALGDFVSYGTAATGTGGTNSIGQIRTIPSNTSLTQSNGNLAMLATNGTSSFCVKNAMLRITSGMSVDATSYFEMASSAPLIFKLNEGAIGDVYGTVNISANFQKLVVVDSNNTASLTFYNGSKFQFTGTQSSAPFDGLANANNNNVIFKYGSRYENNSTTAATANSCGSLYGAIIPFSVVSFEKGSTYVQNSTQLSSMLGSSYRTLPNVILNGTTSSMQSTTIVDTLTIGSNTNWTNASGSFYPIKGDFIINGTYTGAATTPVFVFCGGITQNITVNGSIASGGLNKIIVSPSTTLKLGSNVIQSVSGNATTTSYTRVFGTIDFSTYTLSSASTTSNTLNGYNSTNITTGTVTGGVVAAGTPYLITFPLNITGLTQGMEITGTGIPSNTVILNTSGLTIFTSNPIPANASLSVTSNVNPNGATFITANSGGLASSYSSTLPTFSFPTSTGPNYVFNGATTTPFPSSFSAAINANNFTSTANVTLNKNLTVSNLLTVSSGRLTTAASGTLALGASASGTFGPTSVLNIAAGSADFNSRPVTVQASATSVGAIINSSALSGTTNVTLQQWVTGQRGYRILSNPFNTALSKSTIASVNGITISGVNDVKTYNSSNNTWASNISSISANTPYSVFIRGLNIDFNGTPGLSNYKNDPTAFAYNVTGTLNGNSVTLNQDNSSATAFTIAGNPFAAPVNSSALTGGTAGKPYYIYSMAQNNTGTRVKAGGWVAASSPSSITTPIPMMGVVAYQAGTSASSTFVVRDTSINTTNAAQPGLFGEGDAITQLELQLAKDGNYQDKLFVRFDANSTEKGDERMDLPKLNNDVTNIYTLTSDKVRLAVDARKGIEATIPVGITSPAGRYTFTVASNNFVNASNVYLLDKLTNTKTALEPGATYSFEITSDAASQGDNRFELGTVKTVAQDVAASNDNFSVKVLGNVVNNAVTVQVRGAKSSSVQITVLDMQGKLISNTTSSREVNNLSLASGSGMYLIKVTDGNNSLVSKVVKP